MNNLTKIQSLYLNLMQYFTQIMGILFEIIEMLQPKKELKVALVPSEEEWLTEEEARKLINRGRTWFFKRRKDGSLTYTLVGSEPRYLKESLMNYIEKNRKDAYREND